MEANNLLNIENEKRKMGYHINNISICAGKINQLKVEFESYNSSIEMLIFAIVATAYAVICAVARSIISPTLLAAAGIVIAIIFGRKVKNCNKEYKMSCALNICIIIFSILCFLFFYNFVPVLFILAEWLFVIIDNYRLKKRIWEIASELDN